MKKEFVTYEIALKLKELGFNKECLGAYVYRDIGYLIVDMQNVFDIGEYILQTEITTLAPLWQQVIDWLREKYNYHIDITFREVKGNRIEGINSVYFDIEIYRLKDGDVYKAYKYSQLSDNYYYTRKEAILKAIELCQKEK